MEPLDDTLGAKVGRYLANQRGEASTWRGLVWVLTAVGVVLSPEQQDAILAAGAAVTGLTGAFLPDWLRQR